MPFTIVTIARFSFCKCVLLFCLSSFPFSGELSLPRPSAAGYSQRKESFWIQSLEVLASQTDRFMTSTWNYWYSLLHPLWVSLGHVNKMIQTKQLEQPKHTLLSSRGQEPGAKVPASLWVLWDLLPDLQRDTSSLLTSSEGGWHP